MERGRAAFISRSMMISVAFPKVHGCVKWPQLGRLVRSTRTNERCYLFRRHVHFYPLSILLSRFDHLMDLVSSSYDFDDEGVEEEEVEKEETCATST